MTPTTTTTTTEDLTARRARLSLAALEGDELAERELVELEEQLTRERVVAERERLADLERERLDEIDAEKQRERERSRADDKLRGLIRDRGALDEKVEEQLDTFVATVDQWMALHREIVATADLAGTPASTHPRMLEQRIRARMNETQLAFLFRSAHSDFRKKTLPELDANLLQLADDTEEAS